MDTMVSRTLSVHQEHELLLKLEVAGLTGELAQRVIASQGNLLASRIVQLISGDERQRVIVQGSRLVKTLTVTCHGNATAEQLVEQGKYNLSNDLITDQRFPLVPHDPWPRQIGLVELDHDWSRDQGLAALAAHGLEQPTAEDALYFGIQHPEEQRKRPIAFPHKPVQDSYGLPHVLVLYGYTDRRKLDLHCTANHWSRGYLFAGVRKVA